MNTINQFQIATLPTIADLYQVSNFARIPLFPSFDIVTFEETYPHVKKGVVPHRRGFYSIFFFADQDDGTLTVNARMHQGLNNAILFQSPEHVLVYSRGNAMSGYVLLFGGEFVMPHTGVLGEQFPFFLLLENNLLQLNEREQDGISRLMGQLMHIRNGPAPRSPEVCRHLLMALLHTCRSIYEQYQEEENFLTKSWQLTRRFQALVNNHFLQRKTVQQYANLLHVTPGHLNETIKAQTGKTAKKFIQERLLLEAQHLLVHTTLDSTQVGYYLGFAEPTHFGKFFKKLVNQTPSEFRRANR